MSRSKSSIFRYFYFSLLLHTYSYHLSENQSHLIQESMAAAAHQMAYGRNPQIASLPSAQPSSSSYSIPPSNYVNQVIPSIPFSRSILPISDSSFIRGSQNRASKSSRPPHEWPTREVCFDGHWRGLIFTIFTTTTTAF